MKCCGKEKSVAMIKRGAGRNFEKESEYEAQE